MLPTDILILLDERLGSWMPSSPVLSWRLPFCPRRASFLSQQQQPCAPPPPPLRRSPMWSSLIRVKTPTKATFCYSSWNWTGLCARLCGLAPITLRHSWNAACPCASRPFAAALSPAAPRASRCVVYSDPRGAFLASSHPYPYGASVALQTRPPEAIAASVCLSFFGLSGAAVVPLLPLQDRTPHVACVRFAVHFFLFYCRKSLHLVLVRPRLSCLLSCSATGRLWLLVVAALCFCCCCCRTGGAPLALGCRVVLFGLLGEEKKPLRTSRRSASPSCHSSASWCRSPGFPRARWPLPRPCVVVPSALVSLLPLWLQFITAWSEESCEFYEDDCFLGDRERRQHVKYKCTLASCDARSSVLVFNLRPCCPLLSLFRLMVPFSWFSPRPLAAPPPLCCGALRPRVPAAAMVAVHYGLV